MLLGTIQILKTINVQQSNYSKINKKRTKNDSLHDKR